MMAVGDPRIRHAQIARAPDRLVHRERARREGQSRSSVDQHRAALRRRDFGPRGAVGATVPEVERVLRDARNAVRREPVCVRIYERPRSGRRHLGVRAGARERALREIVQMLEADLRHRAALRNGSRWRRAPP